MSKRLASFGLLCALAAPLLAGCHGAAAEPDPIATGVLEVGVMGGVDVAYFLRLDDGSLVGLDLGHARDSYWPESDEPIAWRSAGGSRVLVYGTKAPDGTLSVDWMDPPSSPVGSTAEALGTAGAGKRRILVVQVQPDGRPATWTPAHVEAALQGTEARLADFSFGQLSVSHDLEGPINLTKGSCANAYDWMNDAAEQMKAKGKDPASYDHFMLVGDFGCAWAGLGMQPGSGTWIAAPEPWAMVHELGHNLGLWHASSLTCDGGKQPMDDPSRCTQAEYGDPFDPMGCGGQDQHYNARAKVTLGWIPTANTVMASGDQTYTLTPSTQKTSGLQLLGVKGPGDIVYQVEYRQPGTYSIMSAGSPEDEGVLIHAFYTQANDSGRARLVDMVPGGTFMDAPLTIGHAYTFYGTTTTITVKSVSPDGAVVHVGGAGSGSGGGSGQRLVALHSGKCVGVAGASKKQGARVVQWICNGSTDQEWKVEAAGQGQAQIRDVNSDLCLTVSGASTSDGAKIVQSSCDGSADQLWKTTDNGDGTETFHSAHSGKCLDVYGGSTADGAALIQWRCHGGNNQRFKLQ